MDVHGLAVLELLRCRAGAEAVTWLVRAFPGAEPTFSRAAFLACYAGVGRRFERGLLMPSDAEREHLYGMGVLVPERWSLVDLVRALLLLGACNELPASEHVALFTEVYRKGDSAERIALLRALALLPDSERFIELAAEACRNSVPSVVAALACDNPFPVRYMPSLAFNQLVMKVLFLELPLDRILGWRTRCDAELLRMARDYEAERRAAGRSISADLKLLRSMELPS